MMRRYLLLFFLLGVFLCGNAFTQSVYSSKGAGMRHYFVSGQSSGMGGVGLAMLDPASVNFMNPATLTELSLTYVSGSFLHEANDLTGETQNAAISNTNVAGVQFVVPISRNKVALGLGLLPYTTIEFAFFSDERSQEDKPFTEEISGDGGINSAFLSLAVKPFDNLYLGATGVFYFGILRNKWNVDFQSNLLLDTRDEVSQSFTGGNVTLGFVYRLLPSWTFGGIFSPEVTLDANRSVTLREVTRLTNLGDRDIEIPLAYGFGTTVTVKERLLLGMDFYAQNWSGGNLQDDGYVNDSRRLGVGIQYNGKRTLSNSYFGWMDYRAGFYYNETGLEVPAGEKITELFGTIGVGLPIKWNAAKISLSFEAGQRGSAMSNPFKETILRFAASVTVGERWFLRPD